MKNPRMFTVTQLLLMFDAHRGIKFSRHGFNENCNKEIGILLSRKLVQANGFQEGDLQFDFSLTKAGLEFVGVCQQVSVELIRQAMECENARKITCDMMIVLLDCAIEPNLHLSLHAATIVEDLKQLTRTHLIEKCKGGYRPTMHGSKLIDYWKSISIVP